MSLLELLGTPAPIRTTYPTRWNSQKVCVEVQCTCATWYRKAHNANCPYCNIDLAEQPAPTIVVTPEPVAPVIAASQEPVIAVENATEATALQEEDEVPVSHVMGSLDYAPDPSQPLTAMAVCMMTQEQLAEAVKAKNATEAYPGQSSHCPGRSDPLCCWSTEDKKPADPTKKQYFVIWAPSQTNDKKRYGLLCRKSDGLAVDCSCGDRVHRGRKQGRCCKHQTAHNAMLAKPAQKATKQQEAA